MDRMNTDTYAPLLYTLSGSFLTLLIGLFLYYLNQRKEDIVKIYSPLNTEMMNNLKRLETFQSSLIDNEWQRINQKEHLLYRIKPKKFKLKLNKFYNDDIKYYRNIINTARIKIDEIIRNELKRRHDSKDYDLELYELPYYSYRSILIGRLTQKHDFVISKFEDVNSQLKNKFKDFKEFYDIILRLSNRKPEIKNARKQRNKIIKKVNYILLNLNKKFRFNI